MENKPIKIRQEPEHRANDFEKEQQVEYTVQLIRAMRYKSDIKRALHEQFGVEHRECNRLIARARARILSESAENKGQTGAILQDKLAEIIGSDTSVANKIRAIDVFARILGLNTLQLNQHVTLSGGELDVRRQRIVESLAALQQQHLAAQQISSSGGQTPGNGEHLALTLDEPDDDLPSELDSDSK